MAIIFILWLLSQTVDAANQTVHYGVLTSHFTFPSLTNVFAPPPFTYLYSYASISGCTLVTNYPKNLTEFCFLYLGPATIVQESIMAIPTFQYRNPPTSPQQTYSIAILNYLTASPTFLGPVFQDTTAAVTFDVVNTWDAQTAVVLLELPAMGEFYIGSHTLNESDVGRPFTLNNNGEAPFRYRPFETNVNLNETIQFYATNLSSTVQSVPSTLEIDTHAANGVGSVTFANVSCSQLALEHTICLTVADTYDLYVNLTFTNVDQWDPMRILTLRIGITYPNAVFSLPADVVLHILLHENLDGSHNSNIDYEGSLSSSTFATVYAPLDLLQAAVAPISIFAEGDGAEFNIGYSPTVMPPMPSEIVVAACVVPTDTLADSCTLDPSADEAFYIDLYVFPVSSSTLKIVFTVVQWVLLILALICCCLPAITIIQSDIEWAEKANAQWELECQTFCRTYPLCIVCACCPCGYRPSERRAAIARQEADKEAQLETQRLRTVRDCGCFMCCSSLSGCSNCYIREDESSSCGNLFICCDYYAKSKRRDFSVEAYNNWENEKEHGCCRIRPKPSSRPQQRQDDGKGESCMCCLRRRSGYDRLTRSNETQVWERRGNAMQLVTVTRPSGIEYA